MKVPEAWAVGALGNADGQSRERVWEVSVSGASSQESQQARAARRTATVTRTAYENVILVLAAPEQKGKNTPAMVSERNITVTNGRKRHATDFIQHKSRLKIDSIITLFFFFFIAAGLQPLVKR